MPLYAYQCGTCKFVANQFREAAERNKPMPCEKCKGIAERILTSPQLNTRPAHLMDENKYALGFSERDRLERMRRDDKTYAKRDEKEDKARKIAEAEMRNS